MLQTISEPADYKTSKSKTLLEPPNSVWLVYIYIQMNLQSGLSNGYHAELQSSIHIFLKMIQWKVIGVLGGTRTQQGTQLSLKKVGSTSNKWWGRHGLTN